MATVQVAGAKPRRGLEVLLMLLAVTIGVSAYLLSSLNREGQLPSNVGLHIIFFVGIALAAEVVVHFMAPHADPAILPISVTLTGLGLAMIHRLDLSYEILEAPTTGPRQAIFATVGVLLMALILVFVRDHKILRRFTYTSMVLSLIILLLPMLPGIGVEHYGARAWVQIAGFEFQPAEFVKITLAIFFAGYLVTSRDKLSVGGPKFLGIQWPRFRDLGPILLVWLVALAVLVLQRDLGTSLLFFGLFIAMLYVATNRVSWLAIGATLFIPAAVLAATFFPHVQNRFNVWLNAMSPEVFDTPNGSYQLVQGQFGMANGGLLGAGWGRGYPHIVPLAESDFILASLAEELGLVGLMAILMLYLVLVERGLRAALGTRDGFGKLLAAGLSFSIALQLFVVLGGITRVIPMTGLTAPFLAKGGSSMLASWITVAVLLRISDGARRPAPKAQTWDQAKNTVTTDTSPVPVLTVQDLNAPPNKNGVRTLDGSVE